MSFADPIDRSWELLRTTTPLEPRKDGACVVDGKRYRYILKPGCSAQVIQKKTGKLLGTACIQFDTGNWYPHADQIIAQYLLIKNDEKRYLKTANLSFGLPKFIDWITIVTMCTIAGIAIYTLIRFIGFLSM